MSIAYISRTETFSAAHRLNSIHLTKEENVQIYGKCNHTNGHGHNYTVKVTIKGKIDERTGMVMNLVDLKDAMMHVVMDQLDHKNLDMDIPYFKTHPSCWELIGYHSTTENLVVFIWDCLKAELALKMPKNAELFEIEIQETPNNRVLYKGE